MAVSRVELGEGDFGRGTRQSDDINADRTPRTIEIGLRGEIAQRVLLAKIASHALHGRVGVIHVLRKIRAPSTGLRDVD